MVSDEQNKRIKRSVRIENQKKGKRKGKRGKTNKPEQKSERK